MQSETQPPRLAYRLLRWFLKDELLEEVCGDLFEHFERHAATHSKWKSKINYWYQVLQYIRPFAIAKTKSKHSNNITMLKSYLLISIRNLRKHKFHHTINILSLAIGLAACLTIYLFISDERSFDQQHSKKDNMYRLCEVQSFPGTKVQNVALSMPSMGPTLLLDFPEVENYTRVYGQGKRLWKKGVNQYALEEMYIVDSTFLDLFDFPLLSGDRNSALDEPNSIILTEESALIIFGHRNIIGEVLRLDEDQYTITGVLEDVPENSHLQFDVLLSMSSITRDNPGFNDRWGSNFLITYLQLTPDANLKDMSDRYPAYLLKNSDSDFINDSYKLYLQPLNEVHLGSTDTEHDYMNYRKFNGEYLDIFALVGLFVLLIAAVNFMNLTIAKASTRAQEVGIRKSIGANRNQLFWQFMVESLLMTVMAFIIAMTLEFFFIDLLNILIDRKLTLFTIINDGKVLAYIFSFVLLLGAMAGLYPALYISSFQPVSILKGLHKQEGKSIFRNTLIVGQFSLAIAMIVATLVVLQQLDFMKNKDIGFDKDHILIVDMDESVNEKYDILKQVLLESADIKGITASGQRLGNNFHQWGMKVKADTGVMNFTPSNVLVHYDYIDVYGIEMVAGRKFSKEHAMDDGLSFIINEACAKELGFDDPVGKKMGHRSYPNDSLGTIIGVTKNFNFNSLHHRVNTLSMVIHTDWNYSELSIKLSGGNVAGGIEHLQNTWDEIIPNFPLTYSFLDEHIEQMYKSDDQMSSVISIMAFLSIFIGCMGLFGLSSIATEQRIKEIGIRKILGASMQQLLIILSKNFAGLVTLSFLIAAPVTYLLLTKWLENFAFRVDIGVGLFLFSGAIALGVAMLTISYHTWRVAKANPIDSLKYE